MHCESRNRLGIWLFFTEEKVAAHLSEGADTGPGKCLGKSADCFVKPFKQKQGRNVSPNCKAHRFQ